jgi:hypothetical protein
VRGQLQPGTHIVYGQGDKGERAFKRAEAEFYAAQERWLKEKKAHDDYLLAEAEYIKKLEAWKARQAENTEEPEGDSAVPPPGTKMLAQTLGVGPFMLRGAVTDEASRAMIPFMLPRNVPARAVENPDWQRERDINVANEVERYYILKDAQNGWAADRQRAVDNEVAQYTADQELMRQGQMARDMNVRDRIDEYNGLMSIDALQRALNAELSRRQIEAEGF